MACLAAAPSRAPACSSGRGAGPLPAAATAWRCSPTARPAGCRAPAAHRSAVSTAAAAAEAPAAAAAQSPALTAFPAVAISRMVDDNRAFVESHR